MKTKGRMLLHTTKDAFSQLIACQKMAVSQKIDTRGTEMTSKWSLRVTSKGIPSESERDENNV